MPPKQQTSPSASGASAASGAPAPSVASSASSASGKKLPDSAVPIKMKDLAAFKWLIINIFGHDYMHDYMINTGRCKNNNSVIEQINKLMSIIAGYKRTKTKKIREYFGAMAGGGKKLQTGGVGSYDDDMSSELISGINEDTLSIPYLENIEASLNIHTQSSNEINSAIEDGIFPELREGRPKPNINVWLDLYRYGDGKHKDIAEQIYIIVQEEKYIEDLILDGMRKNFEVLSENLVANILSEPIKNIVELTNSIGKFLNHEENDWEEEDERSYDDEEKMIETMTAQFNPKKREIDYKRGRTSDYQMDPLLNETKILFENISHREINNQVLNCLLSLNEKNSDNVYNIKNRKLDGIHRLTAILSKYDKTSEVNQQKELLDDYKAKWIKSEGHPSATSGAATFSSAATSGAATSGATTSGAATSRPAPSDAAASSDAATSSGDDASSGESKANGSKANGSKVNRRSGRGRREKGDMDKGDIATVTAGTDLFNFTKNIIFGEILKTSTGSSDVSLFDSSTGTCYLYDISINSINKLSQVLYGIYKSKIIDLDKPPFDHEENYFFEDPIKQELMLLRANVYNIFKIIPDLDKDKVEFNTCFTAILNKATKETFKNIYRFVLIKYHPDKIKSSVANKKEVDAIMTDIIINLSIIGDLLEKEKGRQGGGSFMKGGAGGKEKKDIDIAAFLGINKLLGKSILENSLILMGCAIGDKSLGYFPDTSNIPAPVTDYKLFHKKYPGIKPKFINIFNGEGIINEMIAAGYYDNSSGTIDWDAICPSTYSPGKVVDNGAPLEFRKLLARRILLNIQVLILYITCCPSDITASKLLTGLYLTIDKTDRNSNEIIKRGFWGPSKLKHTQEINTFINITDPTDGLSEIQKFVEKNRTKYFGFMFDFYKKDPPTIKGVTWHPFNTPPLWLTNGNKDDALQFSFNIVLQHLLPECVLYMGNHDMFNMSQGRKDFIRKNNDEVMAELPLPSPVDTSNKAYIISNASKFIFPSQKKVGDDRFGLFNLNGANTRDLNYCSVPSIADNQPTCSVTVDKTASTETYPRSHEYDLEMSVEAEDAIGQTYSYVIEMTKTINSRTSYYISAALSMPSQPSILIGDKTEINDLKGSPLGAVSSFIELLKSLNTSLKNGTNLSQYNGTTLPPRDILQEFFKTNMEIITKMSVKKSIGDYGQEHVAACKWGSGVPSEVIDTATGYENVLPYSDDGNSLRMMLANDRPSAYRNIFMLLFSEENSVNSRAVAGYWNENPALVGGVQSVKSLKNTIVISPATILPNGQKRGTSVFNTSKKTDEELGFIPSVPDGQFSQADIRARIRSVSQIRTRLQLKEEEYENKRMSIRGYTKWLKDQPNEVHGHLSNIGPYMKKNLMGKLKDIYMSAEGRMTKVILNETGTGWNVIVRGGRVKRKTRKRRSVKRKKRTKRRSTKRKKKTIKKRKKKRRRRTKRKNLKYN